MNKKYEKLKKSKQLLKNKLSTFLSALKEFYQFTKLPKSKTLEIETQEYGEKIQNKSRHRIWEIDFVRGFCVILMIFDHLSIMLATVYGPNWFGYSMLGEDFGPKLCRWCEFYFFDSTLREIGHPIVLFLFFSICGISCSFSRSNSQRGFKLLFVAFLYTCASYIGQELFGVDGIFVAYGVLHFLATSILIYALLQLLTKNNKMLISYISIGIIFVCYTLYFFYTPPEDTPIVFAIVFPPHDFEGNPSLFYSASSFSPGDLFTIIPYIGFFLFGVVEGPILYRKKKSLLPKLDGKWHKPVTFMGKYALIVYIVHVAILAVILSLLSYLFITPGSWGF